MSIFKITKAFLTSNVAYFEVPAAQDWQVGGTVTVAGCTTSAFNTTLTALTYGVADIPVVGSSGAGTSQPWNGFAASLTNANIAIELEPAGAQVTTLN